MLSNQFLKKTIILLKEVLTFNEPADKVISNYFKVNRSLDSISRKIIAETIYTILRNYYKLESITTLADKIRYVWQEILKLQTIPLKQDVIVKEQIELPQWIIEKLTDINIAELSLALEQSAPLDIRINLVKTNLKFVTEELEKQNIDYSLHNFSPYGIRLTNKIQLERNKLFLDGLIEVQDQSSQLAGMLLNPKRGEMVVDFCAGAGGKTLLLGMLMRNSGRIYAFDINQKRLDNLTPRLAKSGLSNVYAQLTSHENDNKVKKLYNKIDRVFVDVPCSGLGTLRRNPDLKFRQNIESVKRLNEIQKSILDSASKLLKTNGYLVYATCSILHEENQDIVNQFLLLNPNFKLVPASTIFNKPQLQTTYLQLLPHIHQTDGFFAALLQRIF